MILVIRIIFVLISMISGFIISDSLNSNLFIGPVVGLLGSVLVILIDISFKRISLKDLIIASFGFVFGLIIASLLSYAFLSIPFVKNKQQYIPIILYLIFGYLGISIAIMRKQECTFINKFLSEDKKNKTGALSKILDTSVIIDGRIADMVDTGFLEGTLFIPRFVLQELQQVADSQDPLKRTRGRRGLEMLNSLQKVGRKVEIINKDFSDINGVDEKLVVIAKSMPAAIITNDYNLNKVAKIHGVKVLNINDLVNAVKPVILPSEALTVKIVKEGKEQGQGLAYTDDGTMIVVENGRNFINQTIDVVVTSILQTSAGRIIFTKRKGEV